MQFEISDQERQFIEMLREWSGEDDHCIEIRHALGAWEIKLSMPWPQKGTPEKEKWSRGAGATFDEAWDNVNPSWA
jgi:hypothetical protein